MINDWHPARVSKKYKENYKQIKWGSPIIPSLEIPYCYRCGGECDIITSVTTSYYLDLYKCRGCGWKVYDEEGRLKWKKVGKKEVTLNGINGPYKVVRKDKI